VFAREIASQPIEPDEPRRRNRPAALSSMMRWWRCGRRPNRISGKRLKLMIPTLLPALEWHDRLKLGKSQSLAGARHHRRDDRSPLIDTKITAAGGKRRRVGFYSAVRHEVPIRMFNDWNDSAPGFCEVDIVAHGGTWVAGSFIQTLTMVDVVTGVLAAGDARDRACRRGDGTCTEPVPVAGAGRGLRDSAFIERGGRWP
jgi:hypothetical protein